LLRMMAESGGNALDVYYRGNALDVYYRQVVDRARGAAMASPSAAEARQAISGTTADLARAFINYHDHCSKQEKALLPNLPGPSLLDEIFVLAHTTLESLPSFKDIADALSRDGSHSFRENVIFQHHDRTWKSVWRGDKYRCKSGCKSGMHSILKVTLPNDGYIHLPPYLSGLEGHALGGVEHHKLEGGWYQLEDEHLEQMLRNVTEFVKEWLPEREYTTDFKMSVDHTRLDLDFRVEIGKGLFAGVTIQWESGYGVPIGPDPKRRVNKKK
jgi:hypothetical protein